MSRTRQRAKAGKQPAATDAPVEAATRAAKADALSFARGHALPGFGHPLYPDGDPRATAILDGLALDETAVALSQAAYEAMGARPNVDFALASFARASRLPPDAAFSLFLLGRSVGWAAHIFEQIATGTLIRPRARYEGPELGK